MAHIFLCSSINSAFLYTLLLSESFIRPEVCVAIHLLTLTSIHLSFPLDAYVKTRQILSAWQCGMDSEWVELSSHKSYGIDLQHQEINDEDQNSCHTHCSTLRQHSMRSRNYEDRKLGTRISLAIYLLCDFINLLKISVLHFHCFKESDAISS